MTGTRPIVVRLGLLAAGLLAPLVALELGLRLAGAGGPAEFDSLWDRRVVHYRPHPSRANPWARGSAGALRVAVIGDSFTVGATNDFDDTYALRLERLLNLNEGVPPGEVRVYAKRGWGTAQQLRLLDRAVRWRPELIVLGVFLNDPELPRDPGLAGFAARWIPRPPEGWMVAPLRASRALAWIYQSKENLLSRRVRDAYMRYLYDPEYAGWKLFEQALGTFAETCRHENIRLGAVIFPNMAGLDTEYQARFAHERIAAALERAGIVHRDLLPAFLGTSPLRMAAYPGIDPHPSEIAHRVMAHALFEFLLEERLLDEIYRPQSVYVDRSLEHWLKSLRSMRSVVYVDDRPMPVRGPEADRAGDDAASR